MVTSKQAEQKYIEILNSSTTTKQAIHEFYEWYSKQLDEAIANRIKQNQLAVANAEEFLNTCGWIVSSGEVYSETGYYQKDVSRALKIAAGLESFKKIES